MSDAEIAKTLDLTCHACHSLKLVEQQRLSPAQWAAVLQKMQGWGAGLESAAIDSFAQGLSRRYGPSAALEAPRRESAKTLAGLVVAEPSAKARAGRVPEGEGMFGQRCAACHGPKARGGVGVNLVDRYLLDRPKEFSQIVHKGRGLMPPQPDMSESQLDDVLGFLRSLE
jgi:mono/diheme cytochrome c family protein